MDIIEAIDQIIDTTLEKAESAFVHLPADRNTVQKQGKFLNRKKDSSHSLKTAHSKSGSSLARTPPSWINLDEALAQQSKKNRLHLKSAQPRPPSATSKTRMDSVTSLTSSSFTSETPSTTLESEQEPRYKVDKSDKWGLKKNGQDSKEYRHESKDRHDTKDRNEPKHDKKWDKKWKSKPCNDPKQGKEFNFNPDKWESKPFYEDSKDYNESKLNNEFKEYQEFKQSSKTTKKSEEKIREAKKCNRCGKIKTSVDWKKFASNALSFPFEDSRCLPRASDSCYEEVRKQSVLLIRELNARDSEFIQHKIDQRNRSSSTTSVATPATSEPMSSSPASKNTKK